MASIKTLIGKRVKTLRKDRGLTQEKLAEKADVNPKYISSLELGKENPTLETFEKLSNALGLEVSDLFIYEHEEVATKKLQKNISNLLSKADTSKLQMTAKLVKAILK